MSGSPDESIFNLPQYLEVLCRATGERFAVLGVRYGGELVGGVALYENDSRYVPIADLELLWSRVEQNLRRLIKRCEKDGMTVTDDDDFEAFFRMHANTMERKGQGPYLPEPTFRRYFETLRAANLCRLFHVRLPDGRPISTRMALETAARRAGLKTS